MTRGNQRDLARQKNMKKQQDLNKGKKDDGLTHEQRKERDADALRAKQAAKAASKEAAQGETSQQTTTNKK